MLSKSMIILLIGISAPTFSFAYYTVEGSGFAVKEAKSNTKSLAHQYCLSETGKPHFPINKEWLPDENYYVHGNCLTILDNTPPITCTMNFECLNSDLKEDEARMEEILEDIGYIEKSAISKFISFFD